MGDGDTMAPVVPLDPPVSASSTVGVVGGCSLSPTIAADTTVKLPFGLVGFDDGFETNEPRSVTPGALNEKRHLLPAA